MITYAGIVFPLDKFIINTDHFQLTQADFIIRLLVSIGIGAVIGLEREHAAMMEKAKNFAGIRTFIFVVILGLVGGMLYYLFSPFIYIGVLIAVVVLTGISYFITASKGEIGATTEFSLIISFFLGTLVLMGKLEVSLSIMVVVVVLLSLKLRFRSIVDEITAQELYDLIRFVVIALLIFPFLPNENFGPYNIINPREIGWVIILTSGVGLVGYTLMKFLGTGRGILLSGIVGGLVSSTAVTWVFAKKSKESDELSGSCAIAILSASSIMVLRVLVWTWVFNRGLFNSIVIKILLVFIACIGAALLFYFRKRDQERTQAPIRKGKPLDLQGALVFGLIYIIILLVVNYANEQMGDKGLLISSAIAGLSDIDAITITISKLAQRTLDFSSAADAILVAVISNTVVKMSIALWVGSKSLRRYLYMGYGIIIAVAVVILLL